MDVRHQTGAVEKALTTGFDWSNIGKPPEMPKSFDAILDAFVTGRRACAGLMSMQRDEELYDTIRFPTGPGRISDVSKIQFLWFCLHDQIHHRGQFSVYLRMADRKVHESGR